MMIEIYSNELFKIIQYKDNSVCKIIFSYPNKIIINSIIKTKLITGVNSTEEFKIIKFKAESVKTLEQYKKTNEKIYGRNKISVNEISKLVNSLSLQLKYLLQFENNTILGYHPQDIIVVNENKFIFINSLLLREIQNENILISFPFKQSDFFLSPELLKINILPSYIHYKTTYFSFALLLLYLLTDDNFYKEYLNYHPFKKSHKLLDFVDNNYIRNTKLYSLISRCLVEDPKNRSILFI